MSYFEEAKIYQVLDGVVTLEFETNSSCFSGLLLSTSGVANIQISIDRFGWLWIPSAWCKRLQLDVYKNVLVLLQCHGGCEVEECSG